MSEGSGEDRVLRYGFAGVGRHAADHLLPSVRQLPRVRIEAIASRDADRARLLCDRHGAAWHTGDWHSLVDPARIDAIVATGPPGFHAEVARACLAADVPIFVEKPPCPSTAVLTELIRLESASPAVSFVGFNCSFGTSYRMLVEKLGDHGPVCRAELRFVSSAPPHAVGSPLEELGSLLYGLGVHAVDLAVRLFGRPRRVTSHALELDGGRLALHLVIDFVEGGQAVIELGNYSNRFEYRCRLLTRTGAQGLLDQHNRLVFALPGRTVLTPQETLVYDWPSRRGGYDRTGYQGELEAFDACIRSGTPSPSTFRAALDVYRAIDQVREDLAADAAVSCGDPLPRPTGSRGSGAAT